MRGKGNLKPAAESATAANGAITTAATTATSNASLNAHKKGAPSRIGTGRSPSCDCSAFVGWTELGLEFSAFCIFETS